MMTLIEDIPAPDFCHRPQARDAATRELTIYDSEDFPTILRGAHASRLVRISLPLWYG